MSAPSAELVAATSATRLRPGRHLYLGLFAVFVLAVLSPARANTLWILDGLLLLAFGVDARRLRQAKVDVMREASSRLTLGQKQRVTLTLQSHAAFALSLQVRDETPAHLRSERPLFEQALRAHESARISYEAQAERRGRASFGSIHVRKQSAWGLCAVDVSTPAPLEVLVVPQRPGGGSQALFGPRDELGEVKRRLLRAPQSAGELESLREYVPGDPLRTIDWKATAKRRHPVTRIYQPERAQTLWIVIDASRTMIASIGERDGISRTRFDVATETGLSLSRTALRAGDQVGLLIFGDRAYKLLPPARGRNHERRLLEAMSDAHAELVPFDVRALIALLETRARKRALLAILTDLDNETHSRALSEHAPLFARRHLTLVISLDDREVRAIGESEVEDERDAYDKAAALDLLEERTVLKGMLEKRGVSVLEASEATIARATIERYLRVKTHARL